MGIGQDNIIRGSQTLKSYNSKLVEKQTMFFPIWQKNGIDRNF